MCIESTYVSKSVSNDSKFLIQPKLHWVMIAHRLRGIGSDAEGGVESVHFAVVGHDVAVGFNDDSIVGAVCGGGDGGIDAVWDEAPVFSGGEELHRRPLAGTQVGAVGVEVTHRDDAGGVGEVVFGRGHRAW